jgi:hypothetical protein
MAQRSERALVAPTAQKIATFPVSGVPHRIDAPACGEALGPNGVLLADLPGDLRSAVSTIDSRHRWRRLSGPADAQRRGWRPPDKVFQTSTLPMISDPASVAVGPGARRREPAAERHPHRPGTDFSGRSPSEARR